MHNDERIISGTIGAVAYKVFPRHHSISVEYRGLPTDLLAIGAAEPLMVEKPKKPNVAQYDSNGDRYRRRTLGKSGKLYIERMITTRDRSRRLPGVPRDISTEVIDWLDQHPGEIYTEKRPCSDGSNSAWMSYCGTPAVLDAAGKNGSCHQLLDGYQERAECVLIEPTDPELTREKRMRLVRLYIDGVEGMATHFSPETQSRVGVHISAIMAEFDRDLRRPAERSGYLRLVIDNTKGDSAHG
jgi:hypothetical protein